MPQCGQNNAELVLANSTIARLTGEPNAPQPKLLSKTLGVPLELRPLRDLIDDCEEPEVTRAVPLNTTAQDLTCENPEVVSKSVPMDLLNLNKRKSCASTPPSSRRCDGTMGTSVRCR